MLSHVVNAKDRSSAGQCGEACGYCPDERALNPTFDQRAQKRLSRDTDKNGTAKIHKLIEPGNDLGEQRLKNIMDPIPVYAIFPNAIPGSRTMRARAIPALSANISE